MDIHSRHTSYSKWRSGEAKVMVATSAFGMGIDKPDIRNIIRYGVAQNIFAARNSDEQVEMVNVQRLRYSIVFRL